MSKLPRSFYLNPNTLSVARQLIGKRLVSNINGQLTAGIISETEAYLGSEDRASHAFGNKRTKRTETMFHQGGICYVYLCYGIHHLFNVVTNVENKPHAVLVRNIIPETGLELMLKRRNKNTMKNLTSGPGTVTQALGITIEQNALDLVDDSKIWIEDIGKNFNLDSIASSPRIGVDYAGNDASLPYRFRLKQ